MAFLSIHTMTGDPDDLLDRKRRHMDPVVERLAPRHGAILSVTSTTDDGIVTVNLWESAEGAAAFSGEPEALDAQKESGLPVPATFQRFTDATVTWYQAR
ncbi:hypothetical protein [Microbispora sp. ATCC PTA-5024]|uniref:hypothetical protein n=1 Tax=Microbispora sp. ATCC PTA-5024 TaxID=316330 RepID=UPI0003DC4F33|nr:hypothetical protein [Microbispora sp. ATCC PTA-5024]ETK34360.1 hypothetical protein MPTA5024_19865 [Microbispora sp. ATCC PTA-5024]